MIKALITAGVVFFSGLAALPAQADVNGDLNGFFGKLGYSGNVSQAQAWQGQAAGYFSGGSVYLRNPVKNVQLISMQLPSLNAGCGGIDAYLGSFSMISGEEIQRFVKQIMSNAAGYAFDLALQTMVPELKQAKDFLQKLASDVNSMNMSSCQAAQGIIGGLWPVTQVSQQKICQDIAGETNMFADWAACPGDLLRFTATDKEQGQMANHRYTVESVSETGTIRLKGENGRVTINPENVRSQQHIDYGWAVTGYGAQGASTDYVIALEGTEGGRKALATRRAFYISASRVKEHVQIYTDGKADWVKAIKTPEHDIKTAHDALAPETQRKQAKAIWAMGQPVNKTAIGRAWVRHQGMQDASLTAKIIPATRRFPEPALALPVYDNNGRSAGLALVSLVASPEGRMTQGDTRMVMTERARGAVLQRSQSGNTIVVSDLTAALDAVRNHPKDGVVWQTGDESPSAHLLKVSGGIMRAGEEGLAQRVIARESEIVLPEKAVLHEVMAETADLKAALAQEEARRQQDEPGISKALIQENATKDVEEKYPLPVEDTLRIRPEMMADNESAEPLKPERWVVKQIADSDSRLAEDAGRLAGRENVPDTSLSVREEQASRMGRQLANSENDIVRQPDSSERGRMPEREEQTLTRTIQKER